MNLLSFVPSWLWAILLAGAVMTNCVSQNQLAGQKLKYAKLELDVSKQKIEAAKLLTQETTKVLDAERLLRTAQSAQNLKDASNEKTVVTLRRDLDMSLVAGRLRDPFANGCGNSGNSPPVETPTVTANSGGNSAQTGGLLSPELTDFLLIRLEEADTINLAYISCRADAVTSRRIGLQ